MIRIDALWLCSRPQDMLAGAERLLAVVVNTVGQAQAHHGYVFANARTIRLKLLVHDGFGVWFATRRLHAGGFVWLSAAPSGAAPALLLTRPPFDALVVGLPWQRLPELEVISRA